MPRRWSTRIVIALFVVEVVTAAALGDWKVAAICAAFLAGWIWIGRMDDRIRRYL